MPDIALTSVVGNKFMVKLNNSSSSLTTVSSTIGISTVAIVLPAKNVALNVAVS